MASLRLVVETPEVRVRHGEAASVHLEVVGWPGSDEPTVFVGPEYSRPPHEWVSVESIASPGKSMWSVTFDPTRGQRPRPGTYSVSVSGEVSGERTSTVVHFVVERHPCLQLRPQLSITFDPLTSTARVKVALWSCGNVDLDVSWTAHHNGRRLEVEPATVKLAADGGIVDTTLTVKIPDGTVDTESALDIEAFSESGVDQFALPIEPRRGRSWLRRHSLFAAGALIIGALLIAAAVTRAIQTRDDGSSVSVAAATTAAGVSATATLTEPPPVTTEPDPATDPPSPPEVGVEGSSEQEIRVLVGDVGQFTFVVVNRGGNDAEIQVTPPDGNGPFALQGRDDDCSGPLAPDQECIVQASFEPSEPGTYSAQIILTENTTAATLPLRLTGIADSVDLTPIIDQPFPFREASQCPTDAPGCVAFIFTVDNSGTIASPATLAQIETSGGVAVAEVSPVPPQGTVEVEIVLDEQPSFVTVRLDHDDAVLESDEQNNTADWSTVS